MSHWPFRLRVRSQESSCKVLGSYTRPFPAFLADSQTCSTTPARSDGRDSPSASRSALVKPKARPLATLTPTPSPAAPSPARPKTVSPAFFVAARTATLAIAEPAVLHSGTGSPVLLYAWYASFASRRTPPTPSVA